MTSHPNTDSRCQISIHTPDTGFEIRALSRVTESPRNTEYLRISGEETFFLQPEHHQRMGRTIHSDV